LENLALQAVALGKKFLPSLPSIPGPPPQLFAERKRRRRSAAAWGFLEQIPVMTVALLEKSPIQVIVQSFSWLATCHTHSLTTEAVFFRLDYQPILFLNSTWLNPALQPGFSGML
jgi:hypothetical protein